MAQLLQFPTPTDRGPFYLEEGTDGVDSTFDIVSYKTGMTFGKTSYWEARDVAFLDAAVFALALNFYFGYARPSKSQADMIAKFREMNPGPYHYVHEAGDHPAHLIRSTSSGACVFVAYGKASDMTERANTQLLLKALDRLLETHPEL